MDTLKPCSRVILRRFVSRRIDHEESAADEHRRTQMKSRLLIFSSVLICALSVAKVVFAATPDQIDQSIAKAKQFLYAQQKDGNWEIVAARKNSEHGRVFGSEFGGMTAITTYALLASGVNVNL